MRLIDADKVTKNIDQAMMVLNLISPKEDKELNAAIKKCMDNILSAAPTVDAVPVVRCKDCKYYALWTTGEEICFCDLRGMTTHDDDFCSYGERKAEE